MTKRDWKKLRKQNLPETVFFAVTIIAAATLIVPLGNYTQYYSALYYFNFNIPGITVNTSQLSAQKAEINFTVTASNPTGYSGLRIGGVMCTISYYGVVHLDPVSGPTNWWVLTTANAAPVNGYHIGANSNRTISFEITIDPSKASPDQFNTLQQFISYVTSQVPGGQIQWSIECTLTLDSFMVDTIVGPSYFMLVTPLS